jgi:hypothetical protein
MLSTTRSVPVERRDRLGLDEVAPEPFVRALCVGAVELQAVGDDAIQLPNVAVDQQVPPREPAKLLCRREQGLEDRHDRQVGGGIASAPLLVLNLLVALVPAYPLAIVPDRVVRPKFHRVGILRGRY